MKNANFSSQLRRELRERNRLFARKYLLPHVESYGSAPVIVFGPHCELRRHGNFTDLAYRRICETPAWNSRLEKIHTQGRTALPKSERRWRELDSSMSSDALLMNVFCHPETIKSRALHLLLGTDESAIPEFGVKARVPLTSGAGDRTEVDMRLGTLLVESKLTENDFQTKSKEVVESYRDFQKVFERKLLPATKDSYDGYQLIRNVLAAYSSESSFCVLLDSRRPDLIEQWYVVIRAVKITDIRVRCKVLTWQELGSVLSPDLRQFLDEKYGIVPPGQIPSAILATE